MSWLIDQFTLFGFPFQNWMVIACGICLIATALWWLADNQNPRLDEVPAGVNGWMG
jgi:hypothetical protein